VADRSATTRRVVRRALRVVGIQDVLEFADVGAAAAALTSDHRLVIVEWEPTGDGALDFISQLRQGSDGAGLRVFVLSERDQRPDIERAMALGIQGYMLKPFETRVLIEQLAAALHAGDGAAEAA
jgi:DNA-binding NarL/FixJ family response regulator